MADNVNITPGTGDTVAADDIAGAKHQRIKIVLGGDGVSDGDVSATNPMPVTGTTAVSNFPATQPISATALPLPAGASTAALQTSGNASLSSLDAKAPALGQALAAESVPVVLTAAQLTTLTPLSSVSVSNFPGTQPVSGTVTVQQPTGTNLHVVVDSGTITANAGTGPFPVSDNGVSLTVDTPQLPATLVGGRLSVDGSGVTQPISATALPLPTGAATETTLAARLAETTFTTRINTLGQKTMANSTPVVIASDQSPVSVIANEDNLTRLGVYHQPTGTFLVQAAADAATAGRAWLINPVGSGVTVQVRRIRFRSQLGSALVAVTSPRIAVERVTFTGTASGAIVASAKRRTSDANQVSSLRTASTGLTLTAGNTVTDFFPVASATAVGYTSPAEALVDFDSNETIRLTAGEGLVIRQQDAGTAADTRRCSITFVIEEF